MNRTHIAALALALALTGTMGSPAFAANYGARAVKSFAQAEGGNLVVPVRSRQGHRSGRNFGRGHRSGYGYRHRHSRFSFAFVFPFYYLFPYYPYYPYYPSYPSYGYGSYSYYGHHSSQPSHQRRCHPVTGIGRDRYGRKAKFGGTMCYDRYGNSYIVRGSRHVIHYYN